MVRLSSYESEPQLYAALCGVLHTVVLVFAILAKPPVPYAAPVGDGIPLWGGAGVVMVAARSFHWNYEPLVVKLLMIADLPALTAGDVLLARPAATVSEYTRSYLEAGAWVVLGFVQWCAIGFFWALWRQQSSTRAAP